jgi:hypothetical protein
MLGDRGTSRFLKVTQEALMAALMGDLEVINCAGAS